MSIWSFPVRRPVTIVMSMLIVLIVGGISLWRMKLELIPKITFAGYFKLHHVIGYGQRFPNFLSRILEDLCPR